MDPRTFLFWLVASVTGLCAITVVLTQNIVRAATWLLFTLAGVTGIFFLLGADFIGATQLLVYVGGTLVLVVFGVMLTAQGPFISMKTGALEWAVAGVVGMLLFAVLAVSILSPGALAHVTPDDAEIDKLIQQLGSARDVEVSNAVRALRAIGIYGVDKLREAAAHAESPTVRERAEVLLKESPPMSDPATSMSSAVLGEALLGFERAAPEARLTGTPSIRTQGRTRMAYLLPFEIVSVHLLVVLIGAAYLARAKRRRGALP
jgi:NADH-quinone oxidoreductase subunit J